MNTLQAPRGLRDILPEEQPWWQHVFSVGETIAQQTGFERITTPTYEYRQLFERSIGEGTDVMDKELFLLRSRATEPGQEEYALRPEGTAGMVRAFIEHGMHLRPQPVKLYNFVNCFRYDRPQKGRYREHMQYDVEIFGEKGPFADALVILTTYRFLQALGLTGISVLLNSLGTKEERAVYTGALVKGLETRQHELSEDSQHRLTKNPLRILDSKDPRDQTLLNEIPQLADFLGPDSLHHYQQVQVFLKTWGIPFVLQPRLVRGLDYYSHTTFEYITEGAGGQQSALGGGGRYDGLLTQLGGPDVGAVGAGIGLDRVIEELERQGVQPAMQKRETVAVIAADAESKVLAAQLIPPLLQRNLNVVANFDRESLGAQLKAADRAGAQIAYIIGEQERTQNKVLVKNLQNGEQHTQSFEEI